METTARQSAEERREAVLDAAQVEFAARGLHGASTEEIAKVQSSLGFIDPPSRSLRLVDLDSE